MASALPQQDRIRGAFYGLAVSDALGGPVEFKKRGTFTRVTRMLPNANFGLPPGCFTDDTSMALALAHSFLETGPQDSADQARKYLRWSEAGWMSSVGRCFDIGVATTQALGVWAEDLRDDAPLSAAGVQQVLDVIDRRFNREQSCGNGSLMRVLPAALVFADGRVAVEAAAWSSLTTHPHVRCVAACVLYTILVTKALNGENKDGLMDCLVRFVERFEKKGGSQADRPLVERFQAYKSSADFESKSEDQIRSSGYVLDSLEAALWAFFTTTTFADGAIRVVNLGDDADTVGAIYGGLAGAFYGYADIPASWLDEMQAMDLVEDVTQRIIASRTRELDSSATDTAYSRKAAHCTNERFANIIEILGLDEDLKS